MNGALVCAPCLQHASKLAPIPEINELGERSLLLPLTAAAAAALAFVATAPSRRVFSFALHDDASKDAFSRAAESYLLHHLERGFPALEQYKKTRAMLTRMQKNAATAAREESC